MKNYKKTYNNTFVYSVLLFFLLSNNKLFPQDCSINIGYQGFLDNREYFNKYVNDQTFFGNRVYLFGQSDIEKNQNLRIGIDYTYEFGSLVNAYKPTLIANYEYSNNYINFIIGAFHRDINVRCPRIMLSDSLYYYRPLIEGSLFRIKHKKGNQQVWIDWTGRQADTVRESFLGGLSGLTIINNLHIYNYLVMYHLAKPINNINNITIRDNGGASIIAMYNFKIAGFVQNINLFAGEFYSYDRQRGIYNTRSYLSTIAGLTINLKSNFYVSAENIIGDKQVMLYGEKIYRAKSYARFDLGYRPFIDKYPGSEISIAVHLVDGAIDYSQLINLNFSLKKEVFKKPDILIQD